jgi:hypothetical protein
VDRTHRRKWEYPGKKISVHVKDWKSVEGIGEGGQ